MNKNKLLLIFCCLQLLLILIIPVNAACNRQFANVTFISIDYTITTSTENVAGNCKTSIKKSVRVGKDETKFRVAPCFSGDQFYDTVITNNCGELSFDFKVPFTARNTNTGEELEIIANTSCKGFLTRKRQINALCNDALVEPPGLVPIAVTQISISTTKAYK